MTIPGISTRNPSKLRSHSIQLINDFITAAEVPDSAQINQKIMLQISNNNSATGNMSVSVIHHFFNVGFFFTCFFSI